MVGAADAATAAARMPAMLNVSTRRWPIRRTRKPVMGVTQTMAIR